MRKRISISCVLLLLASALYLPLTAQTDADTTEKKGITYIIPIHGMIEPGLLIYIIRNGVDEAINADASAIVFDMNTPGGFVHVAEEIVRLLIDLPDNIKTYTFVNKDALSAGAFIAMATDEIYMAPGSRIGASAIVTLTGKQVEGDMREKMLSSTLALIKQAAKRKGYDPQLVEAMARVEVEYKIGERVICPVGQLLTLTDTDAEELVGEGDERKPLLSSGTVKTLDELLEAIGRDNTQQVMLTITWSEKIARWIETLRMLLLIGGLLGLYIEFKTPGFGIPGIAGIMLLVVFFWGHHVAGLAGAEEALLFLIGIALLFVELFLIPGFGITGIAGIVCIVASLLLAMVEHYPGTPVFRIPTPHLENAFFTLGGALIGTAVLATLAARFLPKTAVFQHFVLSAATAASNGYQATGDTQAMMGLKGVALTPLHPSGSGMFGEKRLPVVARGEFIDAGVSIVVAEVRGNRIVVDKC